MILLICVKSQNLLLMWVQVSRVAGKEDFERFEVKYHTQIQTSKQRSTQRGMQNKGAHNLTCLNELRQSLAACETCVSVPNGMVNERSRASKELTPIPSVARLLTS